MSTKSNKTPSTLAGLLVAGALGSLAINLGLPKEAAWTAAITGLCAVWWVTEAIPIPATSLIPFAAFPFAGVLSHKEVATAYGHTLILLLLGGFILSTAMERSGAHRRIALTILHAVGGTQPRRLVLGFMLSTAALSMWISNTATTLMILPIAWAVLEQDKSGTLKVPLLLGIAYAASIGGLGTPIGTPPNVIFMGVYKETTGQELSFLSWMKIGLPTTALLLPLAWWFVTRKVRSVASLQVPATEPWRSPEKRVLMVFGLTALAWITRTSPMGGWSALLGTPEVGDSTVALLAVVAFFLIPDGEGERLLDWESANKIPWGLLILFGGGIAIARAFEASGLSQVMGAGLAGMATWPTLGMMATICLVVTFLTEVTSNTATTTLLMPILAAAAVASGLEPALLMVPAVLSASCAFMLPVATAPNAIVYGAGVPIRQMAREGFVLNFVGAAVITGVCFTLLGHF